MWLHCSQNSVSRRRSRDTAQVCRIRHCALLHTQKPHLPVSNIYKSQNIEQHEKLLGRTHSTSDASAPEAGQGEKAGVIPSPYEPLCHQPVQFALGQHIVCQVEAGIFPDYRLVLIQDLHSNHKSSMRVKLPDCERAGCSTHLIDVCNLQIRHS